MNNQFFYANNGGEAITLLGEPSEPNPNLLLFENILRKNGLRAYALPKNRISHSKDYFPFFQDFSQRDKSSVGLLRQMVFQGKVLHTISPCNAWLPNFRELLN